jgi:formate dehydrogenase assembly factor FdhD
MSKPDLKLVTLRNHPRATAAKAECLAMLKDMGRRVRAGEIESIAAVMVTRDGRVLHQRTDVTRHAAMLGGITLLERDVLAAVDDVDAAES